MPQSEFLENTWIQYEEFILHKNLLHGANSVLTRQEYTALQRDEGEPEKQKYTSTEPKWISSEIESVMKLPVSESKVTEIKFGALEAEEGYVGVFSP